MPKIVDRDAMRRRILDAAAAAFATHGFHAATIAHVAEHAGLAKGTLYLYFRNKDALAEAMVDRHFAALETRWSAVAVPETLDGLRSQLADLLEVPDDQRAFIPVFFEAFGPSFASAAFSSRIADAFDRLGAHHGQVLAHLQANGEVRPDVHAELTGRALASMLDGMILHRGLFGLQDRYDGMCRETLDLFLRGLRP